METGVKAARSGPGWAAAFLAALASVGGLHAQEPGQAVPTATVEVRQVAGANIYLDLGTGGGLAAGDTVNVRRTEDGPVLGRLAVVAATATRSVLAFVDGSFPLDGGDSLVVELLRAPVEALAKPARAPTPETPRVGSARIAPVTPRAWGRVGLEVGVSHSSSQMGLVDPEEVTRTQATPALRLDATVTSLPGGFTLRARGRVTHRYTSGTEFQRPTTVRVNELSMERRFTGVPAQLTLGRFFSPVESFSGFWDGAAVRFGGESLGAGFLVGLEPDLWSQEPSLDLPKASAFVDYRARGEAWSWDGDVSAHVVAPRADGLETHAFLGIGQRLTLGPLRLRAEVQVDREPVGGGARLSEAVTQATLAISPRLSLRVGAARRERYSILTAPDPFGPRRDRVGGGLSLRLGNAYLSADHARNRYENGSDRTSWTGALSLARLPGLPGVGWNASGSWWGGDRDEVLSAGTGIGFRISAARVRVGYRFHSTTFLDRTRVSHAPDLYLDLPLGGGFSATLRTRGQFGDQLTSQYLHLALTRVF